MPPRTATTIGFSAILLWSLLALFTAASGAVPPFQLAAMTFLLGGLVGVVTWIRRPHAARSLRQRPIVWALGTGGLFGYHALYFAALRWAPPADAVMSVRRAAGTAEPGRCPGPRGGYPPLDPDQGKPWTGG